MRVLVTGGTGFIGRQVARHCHSEGIEVTTFDSAPSALAGIPHRQGDLLDPVGLESAAQEHDVILHLAAVGDVYLAEQDPALASRVNVEGSANVASAALAVGARVVYASTWEVYGKPQYEPLDEEHPCAPDHPYSITKLAGERLLMSAGELRGLSVVSLRIGTAYGAGMRSNSVFSLFADRAREQRPITIHGDGSQTRQFTHTTDIARAFVLAARSEVTGQAFNVVATETVSIKELAELVTARLPTSIEYVEPRPGDVPPASVSAARATRDLGWRAEVPFSEGLATLLGSTPGAAAPSEVARP